ncbi:TPA_asm: cupiennin [Branchiostoma lancelet adintovirus]|uniref:Cupiennin n=1 Tax=Branchiostoma lancelet adintovirus TaxID=2597807 RepID=A0A5H3CKR7_9VIRU|nr:TPA_asm: cupiennin [Branchiostoma lancelet adintovirus]
MMVYRGRSIQRGYGLGGIFRGLFRSAVPLLKRGAKAVGKQALRSGIDLAQDVFNGQGVKLAAKRRAGELGQRLMSGPQQKRARPGIKLPQPRQSARRVTAGTTKGKQTLKRKNQRKVASFAKATGRGRRTSPDIFD